jgi:hypothetical protein
MDESGCEEDDQRESSHCLDDEEIEAGEFMVESHQKQKQG